MMICFYIAVVFLFLYGLLFQVYGAWWREQPVFEPGKTGIEPVTRISVIVPARNEAANIAACVHSICRQDYPAQLMELIIVDDDSTDDTFAIADNIFYDGVEKRCIKLRSLSDNPAPKKRAIEAGISAAQGSLIVTTDADCAAAEQWLKTMALFHEQTGHSFIVAPVKIRSSGSMLSKFQALDFLTMQGITAAAVFKRKLNMCNGANLAYTKSLFLEVGGFDGIDAIASGDDMLLMQKITKKHPLAAGFVRSANAVVSTHAANSWKAFLQQRIRWASKATHYRQAQLFLALLLVYLTNLFIFSFLLMGFFQPFALLLFLFLCVAKYAMEFFFVKEAAAFFQQQELLPWLFILQPLHICYIVLSGFLGQFKSYNWKGRRLR